MQGILAQTTPPQHYIVSDVSKLRLWMQWKSKNLIGTQQGSHENKFFSSYGRDWITWPTAPILSYQSLTISVKWKPLYLAVTSKTMVRWSWLQNKLFHPWAFSLSRVVSDNGLHTTTNAYMSVATILKNSARCIVHGVIANFCLARKVLCKNEWYNLKLEFRS